MKNAIRGCRNDPAQEHAALFRALVLRSHGCRSDLGTDGGDDRHIANLVPADTRHGRPGPRHLRTHRAVDPAGLRPGVDGCLGTRVLEMVAEGAVAARLNALWEELDLATRGQSPTSSPPISLITD